MKNNTETAVVREYDGYDITFLTGSNVMVNATEMAKPFGKTTKDWLRTNSSQEFIASLSAVRQILPTELVVVKQGGEPKLQGTWMHEDVALEFARWLSPRFAIWCNDRIKELFKYGSTTMSGKHDEASHDKISAEEARRILDIATDTIMKMDKMFHLNGVAKLALFKELVEPHGIKVPNPVVSNNLHPAEELLEYFGIHITPKNFFDMLYKKGWATKANKICPISPEVSMYQCKLIGEGVKYGVNYWYNDGKCFVAMFRDIYFQSLCLDLALDTKLNMEVN